MTSFDVPGPGIGGAHLVQVIVVGFIAPFSRQFLYALLVLGRHSSVTIYPLLYHELVPRAAAVPQSEYGSNEDGMQVWNKLVAQSCSWLSFGDARRGDERRERK